MHQPGDVLSDEIGEPVTRAFHDRPRQEAYPALVPDRRAQPVDGDVLGIAETVEAVAFDLPQRQNVVAFLVAE